MSHNTTEEILIRISQQVETIQKQLDEIKKQAELGLKEYFTMGEFAQFGGIPISTAYQISCKNILPKFRVGKRVLFKREDVIAMIEKTRISSKSEIKDRAITEMMTEVDCG